MARIIDTSRVAATAAATTTIEGLIMPEGKGAIGSLMSHSDWGNYYDSNNGTPTSSGAWTTYYNYNPYSDNSAIQFVMNALGDGYSNSGTSQWMLGSDSNGDYGRNIVFSNGNRLGVSRFRHYQRNSTSYPGYHFHIMPVRNTSATPITVTFSTYSSNYWSAGHEGRCLFYFLPNSTKYSSVTNVTGNLIDQSGYSSNSPGYTQSGSVSIPGNTTILVCQSSTDWYTTSYQFVDTNFFYNLGTTFTNPNIIVDMRMLTCLARSRFNMAYSGAIGGILPKIWTQCATDFGDR